MFPSVPEMERVIYATGDIATLSVLTVSVTLSVLTVAATLLF